MNKIMSREYIKESKKFEYVENKPNENKTGIVNMLSV